MDLSQTVKQPVLPSKQGDAQIWLLVVRFLIYSHVGSAEEAHRMIQSSLNMTSPPLRAYILHP